MESVSEGDDNGTRKTDLPNFLDQVSDSFNLDTTSQTERQQNTSRLAVGYLEKTKDIYSPHYEVLSL